MDGKYLTDLAFKASKSNPACARPIGPMSTASRDKLPAKAFGIPSQRKYPMYRMIGGKAVPSKSHAVSAKARARTQFEKGTLTAAQFAAIDGKASRVIRSCGGKSAKRNPRLQNTPGNIADVKYMARSRGVHVKFDDYDGMWELHSPNEHSVSVLTDDPAEAFEAIQDFTKHKKTKKNATKKKKGAAKKSKKGVKKGKKPVKRKTRKNCR